MNFTSIYRISCNCRMEILHGWVESHLCIAPDISLILKGVVHFNQAHLFPKASIVSFYSKIQKMAVDHGLILIAFEISIQFAWNLINEINSYHWKKEHLFLFKIMTYFLNSTIALLLWKLETPIFMLCSKEKPNLITPLLSL